MLLVYKRDSVQITAMQNNINQTPHYITMHMFVACSFV